MPKAHELLRNYDWPGNVRELRHALERAIVLGDGELIAAESLPESLSRKLTPPIPSSLPLADLTPGHEIDFQRVRLTIEKPGRDEIKDALHQSRGNKTLAAKLLKISRDQLNRRLKWLKKNSDGPPQPDDD